MIAAVEPGHVTFAIVVLIGVLWVWPQALAAACLRESTRQLRPGCMCAYDSSRRWLVPFATVLCVALMFAFTLLILSVVT